MNSKIDVFSTAFSLQEEVARGKTIVVIDVLRASSTIVTALGNKAKGVVPVADMGEAHKIAQNLDASQYLLCGERDGKKIEGYHLGNSPQEYTEDAVGGKTLIFNTTNGTKAIARSVGAESVIIGSFLNLGAVVEELKASEGEILLLCAGWKNRLSLEDMLCAGKMVHELAGGQLPETASDGAKVAFVLYERFANDIEGVIMSSNHAQRLKNLVDGSDISFCSQVNTTNVLPVLKEGIIADANG